MALCQPLRKKPAGQPARVYKQRSFGAGPGPCGGGRRRLQFIGKIRKEKAAMGAQWKAKGKALVADAKGKLFGKLAKEIIVAARAGADPAGNSRLRRAAGPA
jgi:hypothetical protein